MYLLYIIEDPYLTLSISIRTHLEQLISSRLCRLLRLNISDCRSYPLHCFSIGQLVQGAIQLKRCSNSKTDDHRFLMYGAVSTRSQHTERLSIGVYMCQTHNYLSLIIILGVLILAKAGFAVYYPHEL